MISDDQSLIIDKNQLPKGKATKDTFYTTDVPPLQTVLWEVKAFLVPYCRRRQVLQYLNTPSKCKQCYR